MRKIAAFVIAVLVGTLSAAEDTWEKVRELKSGTELRIYKQGAKQPISAQFGDATSENLIVIIKDEQSAIRKSEIERIDHRPGGSKITRESRTTSNLPTEDRTPPRLGQSRSTGGTSTSSGVSFSKPAFETIYRRAGTTAAK